MKTITLALTMLATLPVWATGAFTLIEINPRQGSEEHIWYDSSKSIYGAGELSGFTELNGQLYFAAKNAEDNDELWSTNGTGQGTQLVKEINALGPAYIGHLVKAANYILFMATDNSTDWDLFRTDGTANGTIKLVELNEYWNYNLEPTQTGTIGNYLLLNANNHILSVNVQTGTVDTLMAMQSYWGGYFYQMIGNELYFIAHNANSQVELWKTNGTAAGTVTVSNLTQAAQVTNVQQLIAYNGTLYAITSIQGTAKLATINLQGQVQPLSFGPGNYTAINNLIRYNNALYFYAVGANGGNMFSVTAANPQPVAMLNADRADLQGNLSLAGNKAYMLSADYKSIHHIDLNTHQHGQVYLNGYNMPYYWFTNTGFITGSNGNVYFSAYDSTTNRQVFIMGNETLSNLQVIMPANTNTSHPFNIMFSCGMADVFDFVMWGDKVIVPANFNDAGRELWIFEPRTGNPTTIEEAVHNNKWAMFPNPARDEVTIQTNPSAYCEQQIIITNAAGQQVARHTTFGNVLKIETNQLKAGNYFVTLLENGLKAGTKKLVLTK